MAVISITRLRVRRFRYLPGFIVLALRSARQAKRAQGNLGVELLRDAHSTFWTRTAWTDEESMRAFMLAEPHKTAMRRLLDWCDEASLVKWSQETPALPDWPEAHKRLQASGRRSKVLHPSPAHTAFQIAPPRQA